MKPIKPDNCRNQMQPLGIATYRIAITRVIAVTTLLVISFLATLPEVSRAQPCGLCSDITIGYVTPYTLPCQCLRDTCAGSGGEGECVGPTMLSITLDTTATCCIDSIQVNPPVGVCWEGCAVLQYPPVYSPWANPFNIHISCYSGEGSYLAPPGNTSTYICPTTGQNVLYFQYCSTGSMSGGSITCFWTNGTSCTLSIP
jgi:hypothetical protein